MGESYQMLRKHLDRLPGGFPTAPSGVELRILKCLFSPEEAEMATLLAMKFETVEAIAQKARMEVQRASSLLQQMARKGLIFSIESPDRPPMFIAAQFVTGIWEYHVNELDEALVKYMEEYFPILCKEAFGSNFLMLVQKETFPRGSD